MYKRDSPKPKIEENAQSDNRNAVNTNIELSVKNVIHPTDIEYPKKKIKILQNFTPQQQEFKRYWSQDNLNLGYVKVEYDRNLDMGRHKKKKHQKRFISANVWDRVKINTY